MRVLKKRKNKALQTARYMVSPKKVLENVTANEGKSLTRNRTNIGDLFRSVCLRKGTDITDDSQFSFTSPRMTEEEEETFSSFADATRQGFQIRLHQMNDAN